jgi:hypothetical protein
LCLLVFGVAAIAQTDAPPDGAERERILALMRQYVATYGSRVPDVTYDTTITAFQGRAASNKWHKQGTTYSSRIAHNGHEYYRPVGNNGEPVPRAQWKRGGGRPFNLWDVVEALGRATLVWNRWDTLRGHRLAVFDYTVGRQDSKWAVIEGSTGSAIVPYAGSVYVDPATGAVWRVSDVITDIPVRFKTRYASGTLDSDLIMIGTTQYLLPVTEIEIVRGEGEMDRRTELVYRNYHKFEVDSSIDFLQVDSSVTFSDKESH